MVVDRSLPVAQVPLPFRAGPNDMSSGAGLEYSNEIRLGINTPLLNSTSRWRSTDCIVFGVCTATGRHGHSHEFKKWLYSC